MKMIDVLCKLANGEIEEGSKLKIGGNTYSYIDTYTDDDGYCSFVNEEGYSDTFLEDEEMITQHFLNLEVEMIPPKEKKYLVKFNMRGLKENYRYLNYIESDECANINDKRCTTMDKTHFTKSELQSIRSVREFLEDMQGKFKLIEVEDNEID